MRAMVLEKINSPLILKYIDNPVPKKDELLIRIHACGVCRTDLHIFEGDLKSPHFPLILGHEIVGVVEEVGALVVGFKKGDRVGTFWLASSCGVCDFCKEGNENLCEEAKFTGYDRPGGYAEYTTCKADFAIPLPKTISAEKLAPLLCAGLIGYRAYRKAAPKKTIGFYGFGAAAHLLAPIARYEKKEIYAFTKEGDLEGQALSKQLGAVWASDSKKLPPVLLDAAILFAAAGELIPQSLKALKKGGRCICAEIHMSQIPSFPYQDLWGEKKIESVANLTREDARLYFELFPKLNFEAKTTAYPLERANEALQDLQRSRIQGAAVLIP
jgi:propanol-preferring alcohol dehydrogenase